jgi:hypothetical protein
MVTCDGAGASHDLITRRDALAARSGYQVIYSAGWVLGGREKTAITAVPEGAWQIAVEERGEIRERRADGACGELRCAHRRWGIDEAHLTELTGLLREGPAAGQLASIDAAHRVHARVEDAIRTGKDCGIGKFPSASLARNKAWLAAALTVATLLAWLRLLTRHGRLARAEPKTLRERVLRAAARLTRGGRQRRLAIQATWPWAAHIVTACNRITALPQAP